MNKNLTLMLGFAVSVLLQLTAVQTSKAQDGTQNDRFLVEINFPNGTKKLYRNEPGGFGYSAFGPDVTGEVTYTIGGWVRNAAGDSLGCSPGVNTAQIGGKAALVRRGTCPFERKVLSCQAANAALAIVINNATGADNLIINMADTDTIMPNPAIPSISLCRAAAADVITAVNAGQTVTVTFRVESLYEPTAEFSYAIPVSQADTMPLLTVNFLNRTSNDLSDVDFKIDIKDPNGQVTSFSSNYPFMPAGADSLINFDEYIAPAIEGEFTVTYSNNKFTNPWDTITRKFAHTKHTYATDNLQIIPGGAAPTAAAFTSAGKKYRTASMVKTGSNGFKAAYATFGMGNAAAIVTPDPSANVVGCVLYDADFDNNGTNNLTNAGFGVLDPYIVAFGNHTIVGTEPADSLIHVPLEALTSLDLKKDHLYYIMLFYDGSSPSNNGTSISFSYTADVFYNQFTGIGLHTPLYLNQMFAGFTGATVVTRLQEDGFNPATSVKQPTSLADSKVNISPNPANEVLLFDFNLDAVNQSVAVTLIDMQGQMTETQRLQNVQQGQLSFNVANLPSGTYLAWIRTAEGATMKKVAVCH